MSGKFGLTVAASLLSLMLVGCGGDENSSPLAGTNNSGADDGVVDDGGVDDGGQAAVGAISLLSDSPQIGTSSASQVTLTARVNDSNGVLLPEIPVTFSTADATLLVSSPVTDASGSAQAILTNSSDPRNRTINVSASAGEVTGSVAIQATGTSMSISGPTAVSIGSNATYTVRLTDSSGKGISGETISLSGNGANTLSQASDTTSATGSVTLTFSAENSGSDTITVSAYSGSSRIQASVEVQVDPDSFLFNDPDPTVVETIDLNTTETLTVVLNSGGSLASGEVINFTASRGALSSSQDTTNASGEATVDISSSTGGPALITATTSSGLTATRQIEFIATNPTSIIIRADNTQLRPQQETEITAVLRDTQNNLVKGLPVIFSIVTDESNGELLESQVITDSLGRATVTYRAGNTGTGNGGVVIKAETSEGTQPSSSISLTVGGQALRITLGTGNEIIEPNTVIYDKEWVAFVTDVNGAPASGANIELKLLPISYGKGQYVATDTTGNGEPDQWVPNRNVTCAAEDINNGNGIIDPGEDLNNNGKLDPSNDATFAPATLTAADDGSAEFSLLYPQSNCAWVDFRLTATVEVDGSESQAIAEFTLSCSAEDLNNIKVSPPGGTESKYGSAAACSDPN